MTTPVLRQTQSKLLMLDLPAAVEAYLEQGKTLTHSEVFGVLQRLVRAHAADLRQGRAKRDESDEYTFLINSTPVARFWIKP